MGAEGALETPAGEEGDSLERWRQKGCVGSRMGSAGLQSIGFGEQT